MPCFPDIADEHTRQQIVDRADPFEREEADDSDDGAADELVAVFDRGRGRVGEDEKGEVQRGYLTGAVGGSVRMKKAKYSAAWRSGARKISATVVGSAT
jgi:hypothetical protein